MSLKKIALLLMAVAAFAQGILATWARSAPLHAGNTPFYFLVFGLFFGLFLIFLWLRGDELEYRYRRTVATNIGIAALALVMIPVYLYRSRPRGKRAKAIGLFLFCLPATYAFTFAGVIVGMLIFGLPKI